MAISSTSLPTNLGSIRDTLCQNIESRGNEMSLCLRFYQLSSAHSRTRSQRTVIRMQQSQNGAIDGSSKKKIANLCVQRKQVVSLPTHVGISGDTKPLSEFLSQRAGMQSVLNTNALQSHEFVGSNTFRCTLPKLEILKFEVAPVVDLCVVANEQECIVEMLSCKFQGSEVVESQNKRFSANMRNHLTWDKVSESDQTLEVNVQLNVSLEVYTLPFTMLPLSAVETPGNAILQAMVDRMVPIFVDHLLEDYYQWSQTDDDDDAIKVPMEEPFCEKIIST